MCVCVEWKSRSIRRALGHESDIDMADVDAHDMDDVSWTAEADTSIEHVQAEHGGHQDGVPEGLVSDVLLQTVRYLYVYIS